MDQVRRTGDGRLHLVVPHMGRHRGEGSLEPTFEILLIDDFMGRPDSRVVEDRKDYAARPDTLEKVARDQRLNVETSGFRALRDLMARGPARHAQSRFDADGIHVQFLNVSADDLLQDFEDSPTYQKSGLHKIMHAGHYGGWVGTPYAALVLGSPLRPDAQDARVLRDVAMVCQDAAAVVIAEAHPGLWGVESFGELDVARARRTMAELPAAWSGLLRSPLARNIALSVPCPAPGSTWSPPGFAISATALAAGIGARWDEHGYPRDLVEGAAGGEVAAALVEQGLSVVEIGEDGAARIVGAQVCPWRPEPRADHALGLKMVAQQVCRALMLMLRNAAPVMHAAQLGEQMHGWLAAQVAEGALQAAEGWLRSPARDRDDPFHELGVEIEIAGFPEVSGRASGAVGLDW